MIYLGGKWAAKGKSDSLSARRRPAVGKKLVKRVKNTLLTLKCEKTIVFAKNLRFAAELTRERETFLQFVGKAQNLFFSIDKYRTFTYNVSASCYTLKSKYKNKKSAEADFCLTHCEVGKTDNSGNALFERVVLS